MNQTELFVDGLITVLKIVKKDTPVLVEASKGKLFIASYNDFHSIVFECETAWEDFKVILSAEVAKQLPRNIKDTLTLEFPSKNVLVVKSKGVELKLTTLDADSLSLRKLMSKFSKDEDWIIGSGELKLAFNTIGHSANDKDIGDVVLKGYHLTRKNGSLEFMASNGAVMSVASWPLDLSSSDKEGTLLLNEDFASIISLLYFEKDAVVPVRLAFKDDTISIEAADATKERTLRVVSALTNGTPFNYVPIIESVAKENPFTYTLFRKDLLEALKTNAFFTSNELHNRVTLKLGKQAIEIESQNMYGQASTKVPLVESNDYEPVELLISGTYLINYLSTALDEEVTLSVKDDKSPVMFTDSYETEIITLFTK